MKPMSESSVSVVIPTYQRRGLVASAVRSAIEQTRPPSEIIVIDDGSDDGTEEALEPFADRITYRWQSNRGVSAARNLGLRLAAGTVIAFLDADDRWERGHLEVLTGQLERHPEASLACTGPVHPHLRRARALNAPTVVDALYALLPAFGLLTTPSRVAVRREALEEINGFDEELMVAEDSDLYARLAIRAPFALSSESTVVRGADSRSLSLLGMRECRYLEAFQMQAENHAVDIQEHRPNDRRIRSLSLAQQHHARALTALANGLEEECKAAFREAVALAEWLSDEPRMMAHRVARLGPPEHEHVRFERAASSWPDKNSQTASFLRARALAGSLRRGDLKTAARTIARCPRRATPSLLGQGLRDLKRDSSAGPL
jgi:GT2 family glycosyltransferase